MGFSYSQLLLRLARHTRCSAQSSPHKTLLGRNRIFATADKISKNAETRVWNVYNILSTWDTLAYAKVRWNNNKTLYDNIIILYFIIILRCVLYLYIMCLPCAWKFRPRGLIDSYGNTMCTNRGTLA